MKNLTKILLISPLFFISSCEEEGPIHGCLDSQALNYNPEAYINNNSCEYLELGAITEGGIVFYLDETGEHGLVAALEDLTEGATIAPYNESFVGYEWGCYNENVIGADGITLGTGYNNTVDIVNYGCETEEVGITAAQAALDVEINGFSDWYLPSIDELSEIHNMEIIVTENAYSWYWSSSEMNNGVASCLEVYDDFSAYVTGFYKFGHGRVRVIRAF